LGPRIRGGDDARVSLKEIVKRPPDRKLVLAVAVLIVAASAMLARSADQVRGEQPMNPIFVGGR
jgi:hypothetical protein